MRGLILVDLDNVLDNYPKGRELSCFVRAAVDELAARVGKIAVDRCTVALALNTTTATRTEYRLSFEALREAAAALATGLRATLEGVELGLVLTMPQAADALLERLARAAPSPEASGDYTFAALFTFDRGLITSLHGFYSERNGWSRASRTNLGAMWKAPFGVRPIHRTAPQRARGSTAAVAPAGASYSVVIDSDELAAWASTRPIDVAPETTLPALARGLDRDPWILSQIGATSTSLRGLQRMQQLPSEGALLADVSKSDRIEVRGGAASPTEVSGAEPASVGIGAARFKNPGATVASRLPVGVLATKNDVYLLNAREINVGAAMQRFRVGEPLGPQITVRFTQHGPRIVARVHSTRGSFDGWWVKDTRTTVEQSFSLQTRLAHAIDARAQLMKSPANCDWRVSVRSVLRQGDLVRLENDLATGEVGQGWLESEGDAIPAAIYAIRSHHRKGDVIAVQPVHEIVALDPANYPESLGIVPLMVPL